MKRPAMPPEGSLGGDRLNRPNGPVIEGEVIDPDDEPKEIEIVHGTGSFSPEEREQVVRWIGQGVTRNEISRRTGRGVATITRIAQAEGLSFSGAEMMRPALERQGLDLRARRLALADGLLDDARRLREQLFKPSMIYWPDYKTGGVIKQKIKEPTAADKRNLMTAIGIAVDKVAELERLDTPQEGKLAVIALVDNLRIQVARDIHNNGEEKIDGS